MSLKQREIKFEPSIKLNLNIYKNNNFTFLINWYGLLQDGGINTVAS